MMNNMSGSKEVKVSVRDMVEFVLRSGSIDAGYMSMKRAQEGTRIHKKIQRDRKKQAAYHDCVYESEVTLRHIFTYKEFQFAVEGRADGIMIPQTRTADSDNEPFVTVEEIKSTTSQLSDIQPDPEHWHLAQAKCYGYMYAMSEKNRQNDKMVEVIPALEDDQNAGGEETWQTKTIGILLTYCQLDTEEVKSFETSFSLTQLEAFFYDCIEKYYVFAKMDYERIAVRNETAKALSFPYPDYRRSQREFAVAVYRTIQRRKRLFAQAPTGTGKTISTLFPAVKALGEGLADKIFYTTAKTITRQVAGDAFETMSRAGLVMRNIAMTAKEKLCFEKGAACRPEECVYADGYFDRVNEAILDIIQNETNIRRRHVEEYARKHRVCPSAFSMEITLFCDCIICDYNNVYDPKINMKRFFGDQNPSKDYIILNDESHNLVDRAREMFSAQINKSDYMEIRKEFKNSHIPMYRILGRINQFFLETNQKFLQEKKTVVTEKAPMELFELLRDFTVIADTLLAQNAGEVSEELLDLYFKTLDFLRISELFDERYVFYMERTKYDKPDTVLRLLCLDPSYLLAQAHGKVTSSIFFSATLTPLFYFRQVLGGDGEDYTLSLRSPFDRQNLCLLVDQSISTMYKDREQSYDKIAECIYEMLRAKAGNYFVFFSSYEYMEKVITPFQQDYAHRISGLTIMTQSQNMAEDEKEQFLQAFTAEEGKTIAAFVVLGGIFSEGIDLAGDRLIGAAVIGVGLPMVTPERDVISDYYRKNSMNGFEYAYVFPGMNKVMQAAGRVIRSETDRGVVLLIDSRYAQVRYRELFPRDWEHAAAVGRDGMQEKLDVFWRGKKADEHQ